MEEMPENFGIDKEKLPKAEESSFEGISKEEMEKADKDIEEGLKMAKELEEDIKANDEFKKMVEEEMEKQRKQELEENALIEKEMEKMNQLSKEIEEGMEHYWEQGELEKQIDTEMEVIDKAIAEADALQSELYSGLERRDELSIEDRSELVKKYNKWRMIVDNVKSRLKVYDAAYNEVKDKQLMKEAKSR